jgi:hypothetical protein
MPSRSTKYTTSLRTPLGLITAVLNCAVSWIQSRGQNEEKWPIVWLNVVSLIEVCAMRGSYFDHRVWLSFEWCMVVKRKRMSTSYTSPIIFICRVLLVQQHGCWHLRSCIKLFSPLLVVPSRIRSDTSGIARILKGGSFSQKSWIFTVNFQDFFLCSRFSRSIAKVFLQRGSFTPWQCPPGPWTLSPVFYWVYWHCTIQCVYMAGMWECLRDTYQFLTLWHMLLELQSHPCSVDGPCLLATG